MTEYNDDRYENLIKALADILEELSEMEGNTEGILQDEVDQIFSNLFE